MAEERKRKATELSDFEGLQQIGHGAFGTVFRALHKQAKKTFALKRISKKAIKAQNMITQLNNEIKISRQLDHPNIIKLYDTFDSGEDIYLVLELAANGQLFSKLCKEGRFDERNAKRMIREVMEAVAYLHSRTPPIIHRDIKPENILLDKNNHVKLADFGWSNFLNKPRNTYCGTFDYLAPEMIDKSGHDEKLDIWCLGVLAYELLTGKTPFVVQCEPEVRKNLIEKNILEVNISFPNDFSILAKNFILSMVKRRPEERLTLKELMNHEWLTTGEVERPLDPPMIPKKPTQSPIIDVQQNNVIASLNKRIRELEEEVNNLRVNEKAMANMPQGRNDSPELAAMTKELRRLKGIENKNSQLQADNQKYWEEIAAKDKEIIQLRGQVKVLQDNQESIDKLKADKKALQEKIKKLEREHEDMEIKNSELAAQLAGLSDSLGAKLTRGERITLAEAQTEEFLTMILEEMRNLQEKHEDSKKVLQKVLAREKFSKEKENELSRLRVEQKTYREEIRAQLKEEYEQYKDRILLEARTELSEQRDKWLKERAQLKQLYEGQSAQGPSRSATVHDDLQTEVSTLRKLQSYQQSTINDLKMRIREFQSQEERRKK